MERAFNFTDGRKLKVGTMFCVGSNYSLHAKEMGGDVPSEPVIFLKPPQAYVEDGGKVILPSFSKTIHHEVELIVVIGRRTVNVTKENACEFIAGYGVGIDVTLRDIQNIAKKEGKPWATSKGFYSSAPISKIVQAQQFGSEIPDFEISLRLNNVLKQKVNTSTMERPVGLLIEYLSSVFTLEPGDCIFTGTPEGVGPIVAGDRLEAELAGYVKLNVDIIN